MPRIGEVEADAALRWTAALFDLDGTLVDTSAGVRAAFAAACSEVAGTTARPESIDLSLPLDEMIARMDPAPAPAQRSRLSAAFRSHYDSSTWRLAEAYPGAELCLRDLVGAGIRVFVVTNKRHSAAARILEHFGLAPYLDGMIGQDDAGPPVPKVELASRCIAGAGLDAGSTVVIGDSDQDAVMAAHWKMMFIGVTSGAGPLSHGSPGEDRVQLASLADVTAFVLGEAGEAIREP